MDYRRTLPEFYELMAELDEYDDGGTAEYQVHIIGDKSAVVLTGVPSEVMCWSSNLDNAVKIAQALNEAEGR
ncbi:MAG: hypothetical protein KGK33_06905 [Hyphomicrobiales bacterium]|nr:hypothetical protein [Hyphomicrobiales bacterium]